MFWIAIIIYCLLVISPFILERIVKKKFNLPNKLKYKRLNKNQTLIEILITIIFIIGVFMSSINIYEDDGIYRSLNPIPFYWWLSLFMLVIFGYRGYMAKKFAEDSREYYIYFAFAVWNPLIVIITYHTTELFFN